MRCELRCHTQVGSSGMVPSGVQRAPIGCSVIARLRRSGMTGRVERPWRRTPSCCWSSSPSWFACTRGWQWRYSHVGRPAGTDWLTVTVRLLAFLRCGSICFVSWGWRHPRVGRFRRRVLFASQVLELLFICFVVTCCSTDDARYVFTEVVVRLLLVRTRG